MATHKRIQRLYRDRLKPSQQTSTPACQGGASFGSERSYGCERDLGDRLRVRRASSASRLFHRDFGNGPRQCGPIVQRLVKQEGAQAGTPTLTWWQPYQNPRLVRRSRAPLCSAPDGHQVNVFQWCSRSSHGRSEAALLLGRRGL